MLARLPVAIRQDLLCQLTVGVGGLAVRVVLEHRHPLDRRLREAHGLVDPRGEDPVPEVLLEDLDCLLGMHRPVVDERGQDALDLDVRVELLAHHGQGVLELDQPAHGQILALHGDDYLVRRREGVDRQQPEARRGVDEDEVVVLLHGRERLLQGPLAADHRRHRDLRAGEVDRGAGPIPLALADPLAHGDAVHEHVVHRLLERVGVDPLAHRQVGLGVEIDAKGAVAALDEGRREVEGRGGLCHSALLIGEGDDGGHEVPIRTSVCDSFRLLSDAGATRQASGRRHGQGRGRKDHRRGGPRAQGRARRKAHDRLRGGGAGAAPRPLRGGARAGPGGRASLFGEEADGYRERELGPGLFGISVDPERAKKEWLEYQLKSGTLAGLLGGSRIFQYLTAAAPGLTELVTIGKVWELAQLQRKTRGAAPYDLVIVDAPATGHGIAMLRAPQTFSEVARVGPIHRQAGYIHRFLTDRASTGVVTVALPEEMPVNETLDLGGRLRDEMGMEIDRIVVNQVLPERFTAAEAERLEAAEESLAVRAALTEYRRARVQRSQLSRLARRAGAPVAPLPYLFVPDFGREQLETLAGKL